MAVIHFILAHEVFFCSVGSLVLQEFVANNPKIQSNSIGQMVVAYVKGFFASHSQAQVEPPAAPQA